MAHGEWAWTYAYASFHSKLPCQFGDYKPPRGQLKSLCPFEANTSRGSGLSAFSKKLVTFSC